MTNDNDKNEKPSGADYGAALTGLGLNLLVSSVSENVDFLSSVMGLHVKYADEDFAIMAYQDMEFMLHADATYSDNPLLSLTGDGVIRGAGVELRLYGVDPESAAIKAAAKDYFIMQEPTVKAHGLREAYIVGPDGYVWVPSLPSG